MDPQKLDQLNKKAEKIVRWITIMLAPQQIFRYTYCRSVEDLHYQAHLMVVVSDESVNELTNLITLLLSNPFFVPQITSSVHTVSEVHTRIQHHHQFYTLVCTPGNLVYTNMEESK